MKKVYLKENWNLKFDNKSIKAAVPGDITIDMFNAGLVSNPYLAENYKESAWITRKDFVYECEFDVDEDTLKYESLKLIFKGVDLFSTIYLNNVKLGKTINAFLMYKFDVKNILKPGKNTLKVEMISTLNEMDKIDTNGYFAIFNLPRMFLRKAQCHFGWDWAPKICAYGIIDDVYLECKNKYQIEEVKSVADDKGNASFFIKLNYDNKNLYGPDDIVVKQGEPMDDDRIKLYFEKEPGSNSYETHEIDMAGTKNFIVFKKKDFKLWWPNGYGDHPLYSYKIELIRGGKVQDVYKGRVGFRSILLVEEPKENNLLGLDFYINGTKVFLKGSNWVPPECFTGVMSDEKYRDLILLAKNMNANILRVWGGGAYEKDIFFDLCDENGIMTWQDICLACADIPEDKPEFLNNFLEEVKYQVKRLRNHPSLIYWCGGNEKTGTYGNCITHGDFLVNITLYGLISDLDGTRPYRRQSPHSYTDIGNDQSSGDSHRNSFEPSLFDGITHMREKISSNITPFVSECAVMGPGSCESMRKIFPSDKLWPMNEMWADRLMDNPYAAIKLDFPHRELKYAEDLYGKVESFEDFIKKASSVHAEALRAECEFVRAHSDITGAFLNWMFDDIWPSGTWSIIDYWLEPKQAYYQLKKSFSPLLVSFFENKNKQNVLFIDNQTNVNFAGSIIYGIKKYDGDIIFENKITVDVAPGTIFTKAIIDMSVSNNAYLYAKYNNETVLYSPSMFSGYSFKNDFNSDVLMIDKHHIKVIVKANSFVRALFLHFNDNYKYIFSDNYITLEKDQEVVIDITSKETIEVSGLMFDCF